MLKLVKLERKYYPLLVDMMNEWTKSGERIIPYAIVKMIIKIMTVIWRV